MEDCVFCKIVRGEIPVEKIMEDDTFIAFLSATPVYDGLTVVVPKKHYDSYLYKSMTDDEMNALHTFAKKVALLLDKALGLERCVQVMEGLDVNHAHLKLFPKYPGVAHTIVETEIFNTKGLKEVAEKIREVSK